jgi:hypothetical protein
MAAPLGLSPAAALLAEARPWSLRFRGYRDEWLRPSLAPSALLGGPRLGHACAF